MPYCPAGSSEVVSADDLGRDAEGSSDNTVSFGTVMFTCPSCDVVLGVSSCRSHRAIGE